MATPTSDQRLSEYNQMSFSGGMNLLLDDTRLATNQYRVGFNVRNRYDVLDEVLMPVQDTQLPTGIIQELTTLGNYIFAFVSGSAYYRLYNVQYWTRISTFGMSSTAARFWTCQVPVSDTNYIRFANTTGATKVADSRAGIQAAQIAGASQGNLAGLLVQDNINQPQFIYLNGAGFPTCRTTQSYVQWSITFTDLNNTVVATNNRGVSLDKREYVPIGNCMSWANGILFVVSQDFNSIYRSVSGRPLDFVVNVTSQLANNTITIPWTYVSPITGLSYTVNVSPFTQVGGGCYNTSVFYPGGDATTTNYSVGVAGITTIRPLSTGGIFVSAANANFSVTLNQTQSAPTLFGEYTFNRAFLFNASCISDRSIIDTLGDTRFIGYTGILSFNGVAQLLNEGRNSPFTSTVAGAFKGVSQVPTAAAILYDNYELYSVNTVFGAAVAVYDTITTSWSSFDVGQVTAPVKIFSKIELDIQALFAVTTDNKLWQLQSSTNYAPASFVTVGISANMLYLNQSVKLANPKNEVKPIDFRCIVNRIKQNAAISVTPFVNNRLSSTGTAAKNTTYVAPVTVYNGTVNVLDVNTLLTNYYWPWPNIEQGWKVSFLVQWTGGGSITQFSSTLKDLTPMNPLNTQATTV